MVMLKRKQVILAKVETTYGSDVTPAAGDDAILAINPEIKEIREVIERNINVSTLTNKPAIEGKQSAELTFQVEIKGSGTAGTAPRLGALLQACSMDVANVGGTSDTYTPASSSQASVTIYVYIDGRRHILTGARGTFKLTATAGAIGLLDFTFKGKYTAATATAIVSGTYDTPVPPTCKSAAFSYNSKTTLCSSLVEIDIANTLAQRDCMNSASGVNGFEVTGRKPIMTVDVESQIETSYAFRSDMMSSPKEVSFVIGATAGNICTITVPKYNITNIEYGDAEGILLEKLTGECSIDSSGDDELSIVFT